MYYRNIFVIMELCHANDVISGHSKFAKKKNSCLLAYPISTHVCEFVKFEYYTKWWIHKGHLSQQKIETSNIFAIRGKKPFLFHCVRENPIVSNYHTQQNKFQDQTLSWRTYSLNNEAQNRLQAFFQIILDSHISKYFLPEDCAEFITNKYK